ncbi:lipopolysaccharide heptosyltransferase I [Bordetella genomosp. 9]|uniref:Lipopolysaccharide heptosyltransferase 1 n=1 Tax=Bordetella genomosp. 9 TaxID=1416803 RepID=A0A1W6Z4S1_9BORD|nr:lipopolysaccharide heptosyltransferase I [Bordetella genomosp. 9]ARP88261.1 lipopolysaccharide heptosyltransferase I [Bordetella genomosp. 9]
MLPAMTDIARNVADARIDWVAEETFAEIPSWHPAVKSVVKVAHRRWRKSWWSPQVRAERRALRERLQDKQYDVVLDMQALLKSAWLVRQARGVRHGLDWKSAREPLASLFYDVRHRVEFWQPAVVRQRMLAGLTFGYTPQGKPDFGLQGFSGQSNGRDGDYAVIMPSASRPDKLWPDEDWRAVFYRLREAGCKLRLLAGNDEEARRARHLIQGFEDAEVVPRMNLTSIASVLSRARVMVGLDSGLTHLSAALGRPTIGIYRASTPVRTPLVGDSFTASLGDRGAPPTREAVLAAVDQALAP